MTIKNMVEFAQAEADGAEFERINTDHNNDWESFSIGSYPWQFAKELIAAGKIRIKPKTVTLYKYNYGEHTHWGEEFHCKGLNFCGLYHEYTGISVQNAPIVEGE